MAYKKIGLVAVLDVAGFLPNVTKFVSGVDKMNKTVAQATASTGALATPLKSVGSALGFMSLTAGAIVSSQVFTSIANGLGNIAKRAEDAAESFQLLEQRFATLAARDYMRAKSFEGTTISIQEALEATKGAAAANLEWVRTMAISTPYTVRSLTDMMAYAQAAGFSQKEVQELAQTIGDFAAGMGLQSEHVDRIIWNFAQMMSAGRVLGRELRDLGNSMIPVDYLIEKMAKDADVTKEEMKEMLQSGAVSAREFIATFNEMSAVEFQGAMERLSDTLPFARANLKDFIDTALGLDILKPTLDQVGSLLNQLLAKLMEPSARAATATYGLALRSSFITVKDAILEDVIPAINTFFEALGLHKPTVEGITRAILNAGLALKFMAHMFKLGMNAVSKVLESFRGMFKPIEDVVKQGQSWGYKLMEMFAKGIVAAGRLIVKALSAIASVIIHWLKPKSPPLILPDIDEWGADTMNEYLAGFTQADFSIFEDISSMLERYIGVFSDMDSSESIARILGGRGAAAEVLAEWEGLGDVPIDVINKITKAAGVSNATLTKYFQALVKLGQVMEDVAQLNDILSFSLGKATVINMQVVTSIDDVIKAAQEYDGIAKDALMKFVNALKVQQLAEIKAASAQEELNRVTEYYDKILGDLYEQQRLLRNEIEDTGRIKEIDRALSKMILTEEERQRLELEKRSILLEREIRDTEAAKDAAVDAAQDKYDAAKEEIEIAQEIANVQKDLAKAIAEATEQQVKSQVESYQSLLDIMLKNMELIKDMKEAAAGGGDEGGEGFDIGTPEFNIEDIISQLETSMELLKARLEIKWNSFRMEMEKIFDPLLQDLDKLSTKLQDIEIDMKDLEAAARLVGGAIAGWATIKGLSWLSIKLPIWIATIASIGPKIAGVIATISLFNTALKGMTLTGALAAIGIAPVSALIVLIGILVGLIIAFGPQVKETLGQLGFIIRYWWDNNVGPVLDSVVEGWNKFWGETFPEGVGTVVDAFTNFFTGEGEGSIKGWWDKTVKPDLDQAKADWKANWEQWGADADEQGRILGEKINTWWSEDVKAGWWEGKVVKDWNTFKTDWKANWAKWGSDAEEQGVLIGQKVSTWWTGTMVPWWEDNVVKDLEQFGTDWSQNWTDWWDDADQFVTDIGTTWDQLLFIVNDFFVVQLPKKFETFATDIWDALVGFGEDIINGIIEGIENMAGSLWTKVRSIIAEALTGAEEESDTGSPSRKFAELGKNWMLGLIQGIEKNAAGVYDAMRSVVQDAQFDSDIQLNPSYATSAIETLEGMLNMFHTNMERQLNMRYASAAVQDRYMGYGAHNINNSRTINITVNPKYEQYSSPSNIYYDVSAALAASRR